MKFPRQPIVNENTKIFNVFSTFQMHITICYGIIDIYFANKWKSFLVRAKNYEVRFFRLRVNL